MELFQKDILVLGHEAYSEDGYLCILCEGENHGIVSILLREILKTFGDYRITYEDDYEYEDGSCDWQMITNLPYNVYDDCLTKNRRD